MLEIRGHNVAKFLLDFVYILIFFRVVCWNLTC